MNAGGGYIEQGEQQFIIRGVGLLRSMDDIRNVVVAERSGVPVLISDVAEVRTGHQQRQGMVGMDAQDDIVNGTILMRKGENPSVVLEGVKAKIDGTQPKHSAQGRPTRSVLRPRLADRQHAEDGVQEPRRRRSAGVSWCCSSSWGASGRRRSSRS